MNAPIHIPLENRGLLKIEGPDARNYLQGLVSQDITGVDENHAVYGAFLTAQGRFLFDFFAFEMNGALWLDCEGARRSDFFKRLSMYKLRSDVTLSDETDAYRVHAILGDMGNLKLDAERGAATPFGAGIVYVDPRLSAMGARAVLPRGDDLELKKAGFESGSTADYEHLRIMLGIPDGSHDIDVDKGLLLEYGFEELNGVDFNKGCFMGQELTARTRYRGLVKKRLLPVKIDGPAPAPGTEFDGTAHKTPGVMKTSVDGIGLALIRLEALSDGIPFSCGGATLTPQIPDWVVFQTKSDT